MSWTLQNVTFETTESSDSDWSVKDVIENEQVRKFLEQVNTYAAEVTVTARHESGLSADSGLGGVLLSDEYDLEDWIKGDNDYHEQMKEEAYQRLLNLARMVAGDLDEVINDML